MAATNKRDHQCVTMSHDVSETYCQLAFAFQRFDTFVGCMLQISPTARYFAHVEAYYSVSNVGKCEMPMWIELDILTTESGMTELIMSLKRLASVNGHTTTGYDHRGLAYGQLENAPLDSSYI